MGSCRANSSKAKLLMGAVGVLLFLLPYSLGHDLETAALLSRSSKSRNKLKVQFRGYELLLIKGKGKVPIPKLKFRKIPAELMNFAAGGAVESSLNQKDVLGFPFTTQNTGILQVGLPRFGGRLRLRMEDPRSGPDVEDAQTLMEALYEQQVRGLGEITGRVRGNGEWSAGFSGDVEDIGHLRGSLDSQLDWSLDLDQSYPAFKGITPSASYGVTQDGIRALLQLDGALSKNVHATYAVQNTPGKYGPVDMLHDGKVVLSSGRHALQAQGAYNRKFAKNPLRGSMSYSLKTKPVTLETSVDFDRYRLAGRTSKVEVKAALGRKADESGNRPAEVEVKAGKVAALAQLDAGSKVPRVRFNVEV